MKDYKIIKLIYGDTFHSLWTGKPIRLVTTPAWYRQCQPLRARRRTRSYRCLPAERFQRYHRRTSGKVWNVCTISELDNIAAAVRGERYLKSIDLIILLKEFLAWFFKAFLPTSECIKTPVLFTTNDRYMPRMPQCFADFPCSQAKGRSFFGGNTTKNTRTMKEL